MTRNTGRRINNIIAREAGRGKLHAGCAHEVIPHAIKDPLTGRTIKPAKLSDGIYYPCVKCGVLFKGKGIKSWKMNIK